MRGVLLGAVLLTLAQLVGPEPTGNDPQLRDQWIVTPTQGPLLLPNQRYETTAAPLQRPGDRPAPGDPLMGPEPR